MEPHVFCGPEFILEVPPQSVASVLERVAAAVDVPCEGHVQTDGGGGAATAATGAGLGWTVQPAVLLRIQAELYGVCTAEVRRHVHANMALRECMKTDSRQGMSMISRRMAHFSRVVIPTSNGGVPPPPAELSFVQAKATTALTSEEAASLQQSIRVAAASSSTSTTSSSTAAGGGSSAATYVLLYVTDSRVAAQLHMLCLRNTVVALPHGCRVFNYYVSTGRAAAIVPSQVLQKREALASHYNLDAELWALLEARLTDEVVEQVRRAGAALPGSGGGGRLLTAFEQHEQSVQAVLRYCEQHVRYAGVFDDDEEASPFLVAMGLCWRLGLTMDDVCRHFARHPRRVLRALALYLARYTLAPEDYVYVFTPSLCDEVVIACTADAQVTLAMKDLSRSLLTKKDVVDAWLPTLAKHWQEEVVAPAITFMEECWTLQAQGGDGAEVATALAPGASPTAPSRVQGEGRGVAATFGFRSIAEIAEHAAKHARVLVPQSIATILRRRRGLTEEVFGSGGGGGGAADGDAVDVLDDEDDGDDDSLIRVDVRDGDADGDGDASGGAGGQRSGGLAFPSAKRPRVGDGRDGAGGGGGGGDVVLDPHRRIMREGLALTLSLLGRRTLFRKDDEHYIEF